MARTYELQRQPEYEELIYAQSHLSGRRINRFTHIHRSTDDLVKKVKPVSYTHLDVYKRQVRKEECARAESSSFLKRVYGGSMKLMLAHYLEEETLSSEQISELKRILEEKDESGGDHR